MSFWPLVTVCDSGVQPWLSTELTTAPFSNNKDTTSKADPLAADASGINPELSLDSISAPLSIKRFATSFAADFVFENVNSP